MIDLNVVSRDAVVQEVGWEHHVVSLVPELGVVLVIELQDVACADEAESRHNEEGEPEPHEEGRVVEGARRDTDDQARKGGAHHTEGVVDLHPVVVDNAEGAEGRVLRVLALAHLEVASNLTNEAASLSKALVVDVLDHLESTGFQEPALKSLRHFPFFLILNLYTIIILNLK